MKVNRTGSAPYSAMRSRKSTLFPFVLLIFRPWASRTRPVKKTCLKGTSPMNLSPIMIILATQKKMMS